MEVIPLNKHAKMLEGNLLILSHFNRDDRRNIRSLLLIGSEITGNRLFFVGLFKRAISLSKKS